MAAVSETVSHPEGRNGQSRVDEAGRVSDPTREELEACSYFGIAFRPDVVARGAEKPPLHRGADAGFLRRPATVRGGPVPARVLAVRRQSESGGHDRRGIERPIDPPLEPHARGGDGF